MISEGGSRQIASGLLALASAISLIAMSLGELGAILGFLGALAFGMISLGLLLSPSQPQTPDS